MIPNLKIKPKVPLLLPKKKDHPKSNLEVVNLNLVEVKENLEVNLVRVSMILMETEEMMENKIMMMTILDQVKDVNSLTCPQLPELVIETTMKKKRKTQDQQL